MGNGAAGVSESGAASEGSDGILLGESELEVDLRSDDPQVVLHVVDSVIVPTTVDGEVTALEFPTSIRAHPSLSPPDAPVPTEIPLGGLLGKAIARTGTGTTVGLTYKALKKASDLLISSILLLVLLPLLVILAGVVGITSRGPVFYRQQRIGRDGSTFTIFKFRTMTVDADQRLDEMNELAGKGQLEPVDGPVFKAPDDPRITKVGRILRRTNLDELPQLLNILAGDMALVGPRPLVAEEVETLDRRDATVRQSVRPGITCLWQVARSGHMPFDERMALDVLYVERRSFSLDMTLVFLTPIAVVRGNRSY